MQPRDGAFDMKQPRANSAPKSRKCRGHDGEIALKRVERGRDFETGPAPQNRIDFLENDPRTKRACRCREHPNARNNLLLLRVATLRRYRQYFGVSRIA